MSTADTFPPHIPADRTSLTDDERIGNIVPLPPPDTSSGSSRSRGRRSRS